MQSILDKLSLSPLVFDGAMGTVLYQRGVFISTCYDEVNLTSPHLVGQIHRDYIDAGAEVIETNSFGANRIKLAPYGLGESVEKINRAAVQIARSEAGDDVYVAGSVGPVTKPGQLLTETQLAEAEQAFDAQIAALTAEGVDLILLETFSHLAELQLAARIAKSHGAVVFASVAVDEQGRTAVGTEIAAIAEALQTDVNVDGLSLNCGTGPTGVFDALHQVLGRTDKPVIAMPNAGMPREVGGRMLYLSSPEYFTEYAKKFIELGVRGVGGCCGTTPEHIRHVARAVKTLSGVKQHVEIRPHAAPRPEVNVVPPEQRSKFAAKLLAGQMVSSVELLPPRSSNLEGMLGKTRQIAAAGVDAINIPDGPRASARVSPMIAALEIQRQVGIEAILHYCCRDRNLIGMQSDLLGCYAAGLKNVLIITGDPPKLGDYPDATGVFDVDAIGLTQVVTNLNNGMDIGGSPIDPPTGLFIGVGANPCAVDMNREISRYYRKLDAGAEFAITQPVFDVEALLRFLDMVEGYERTIPIVAGIWPLLSYKNAEFMNNEVPGVVVPQPILDRMVRCTTRDDARQAGIEIAREIIEQVRPRVAGLQVSAPLGITDIALAVLDGLL